MHPQKVLIGHSWIDQSLNIQTKKVAFKLSETAIVYFLTQSRIKQKLPDNKNLQVIEWPNKRPTKLKDFIFAVKLTRSFSPDTIIVHFASTKALIFAGWLLGVPYRIAWYHTLYGQAKLEAPNRLRAWFDVWVRTITYKMATHVITQTPFAAGDAINHQHVHPTKTHIIPNGMEALVMRRASYQYSGVPVTFLYIGRITYTKGCDIMVNTFGKLCKLYNHISLHIVGKGDSIAQLQTMIDALQLQSRIIMAGETKSYSEVYQRMTDAYVLLVPSRIDNYPTVIIEAMACGLPVIGANAGGIPYMIEHGINGFVCGEEQDWLEKCELLISNPALRNTLAANARKTFEEKYAIERHVEKVIEFLHNLP